MKEYKKLTILPTFFKPVLFVGGNRGDIKKRTSRKIQSSTRLQPANTQSKPFKYSKNAYASNNNVLSFLTGTTTITVT